MEKTRSFSQKTRITQQTGAETVNNKVDISDIRQKMMAQDDLYHAEKLGFGGHETHEGWIHAEEAGAATHAAVSAEARHEMVAVAAYYLAEKHGFAGDCADKDWMTAEIEIDATLQGRI